MFSPNAIVLFDAVGTVIKPDPGVVEVYHQLGIRYGSQLDQESIRQRIRSARQKFFQVGTNAADAEKRLADADATENLHSNDRMERELWRRLVIDVFADLPSAESLFIDLWEHFASPEHWSAYDDVKPCWDRLRSDGFSIGLASNFDSRLLRITSALLPETDFVFYSGQVGFRKPSPMFYRRVE